MSPVSQITDHRHVTASAMCVGLECVEARDGGLFSRKWGRGDRRDDLEILMDR